MSAVVQKSYVSSGIPIGSSKTSSSKIADFKHKATKVRKINYTKTETDEDLPQQSVLLKTQTVTTG